MPAIWCSRHSCSLWMMIIDWFIEQYESTEAKCIQLLKICWNLKTLLEILEFSLNLYGPANFCVKCRWSTLLVSSHDKTGYWIAYLRNWSLFLSLPQAPSCAYHVFVLYLGKLVDSGHCIAGQSTANMSWIFLEMPPGISWKFVQLNL